MKFTEEQFNDHMRLADRLAQEMEDTAGIVNAIMDGEDPQQFAYSPEQADARCTAIYGFQVDLANTLEVKIDFLLDILSSACTNRYEAYVFLKGGK